MIRSATSAAQLPTLVIPERYNYVATFLTLACNLNCSYCINLHEDPTAGRGRIVTRHMNADDWVAALNRLDTQGRMPITLQGGEPTVFKHFYEIMERVDSRHRFDLLTNLQFDPEEFARRVPKVLFSREAPYAPIRVSYHPGQNTMEELLPKALRLQELGFRVGIYGVLFPAQADHILKVQEEAQKRGLDFRTKEYLAAGHGHLKYADGVEGKFNKYCVCRTSELLIAPSGYVMRCHSDLYEGRLPVGHILDPEFAIEDVFRPCFTYGHCNPCDVKVKTNRFQIFGHTSCEIDRIRDLTPREAEALAAGDNGLAPIQRDFSRA